MQGGFTIIQTIVLVFIPAHLLPHSNMSLDFQSIRQQVQQLGETAVLREHELDERRALALAALESNSQDLDGLITEG